MGIDYNVMVGNYVKASGPMWLGGGEPFDEWLESDGDEQLTPVESMDGTLFDEGVRAWADSSPVSSHSISINPEYDEGFYRIPQCNPEAFEAKFSEAMAKLREYYREVELCYGVVSFAT